MGCVPGDLRTEPDCGPLLSVSWPPCFPRQSCGRHRAAGLAQLELSVCISDTLRGSNHQGRSFQQQVWLHCNLLSHFMPPGYIVPESLPWAGDHFMRRQKRYRSLPGCVSRSRWSLNMCDFHTQGAEEILGVVPVVEGQLLHTEPSLADGFKFCPALLSLSSMSWQRPLY